MLGHRLCEWMLIHGVSGKMRINRILVMVVLGKVIFSLYICK